ncbi:MAG: hypothetical protein LBG92_02010 [Prevotellaceae bacterium]|jgi:hypothetical protein|nr:hypothetical protein [Prevotellaceae bacterium]
MNTSIKTGIVFLLSFLCVSLYSQSFVPVTGIDYPNGTNAIIEIGQEITFSIVPQPLNATVWKPVDWTLTFGTSSVAEYTPSSDGTSVKIKGKAAGTITITPSINNAVNNGNGTYSASDGFTVEVKGSSGGGGGAGTIITTSCGSNLSQPLSTGKWLVFVTRRFGLYHGSYQSKCLYQYANSGAVPPLPTSLYFNCSAGDIKGERKSTSWQIPGAVYANVLSSEVIQTAGNLAYSQYCCLTGGTLCKQGVENSNCCQGFDCKNAWYEVNIPAGVNSISPNFNSEQGWYGHAIIVYVKIDN